MQNQSVSALSESGDFATSSSQPRVCFVYSALDNELYLNVNLRRPVSLYLVALKGARHPTQVRFLSVTTCAYSNNNNGRRRDEEPLVWRARTVPIKPSATLAKRALSLHSNIAWSQIFALNYAANVNDNPSLTYFKLH